MKMQRFIYFFMIFAISLATDVSVYNASDFYTKLLTDTMTEHKPVSCYTFGYHLSNQLHMRIYITNKPPSMTAINVIYQSGLETAVMSKDVEIETGEEYYWVRRVLSYPEVKISINLYNTHNLCSDIIVAEGMNVSTSNNEITEETYRDICLKATPCVLMIDLKHECEGPSIVTRMSENPKTATPITDLSPSPHESMKTSTNSSPNNTGVVTEIEMKTKTVKPVTDLESWRHSRFNWSYVPTTTQYYENIRKTTNDAESADRQPSPQNVLIYVITSAIVMCVIILVTYLCVKTKYCYRNSHSVETMKINTYATVNEVVYADLSLMLGDSQPPRHKEESPYAQIIGVMKPVDGKTINK